MNFERFIESCPAHATAITDNPKTAYALILKENQDHSKAIVAIANAELNAQWAGELLTTIEDAVQQKIGRGEIRTVDDLPFVDTTLAQKNLRKEILLSMGYEIDEITRVETFTVKNQMLTDAELTAAAQTATGTTKVRAVSR